MSNCIDTFIKEMKKADYQPINLLKKTVIKDRCYGITFFAKSHFSSKTTPFLEKSKKNQEKHNLPVMNPTQYDGFLGNKKDFDLFYESLGQFFSFYQLQDEKLINNPMGDTHQDSDPVHFIHQLLSLLKKITLVTIPIEYFKNNEVAMYDYFFKYHEIFSPLYELETDLEKILPDNNNDTASYAFSKKGGSMVKYGLGIPLFVPDSNEGIVSYLTAYSRYIAPLLDCVTGLLSFPSLYFLWMKYDSTPCVKTKLWDHLIKIAQLAVGVALISGALSLFTFFLVGTIAAACGVYNDLYLLYKIQNNIKQVETAIEDLEQMQTKNHKHFKAYFDTERLYYHENLKKWKVAACFQERAAYRKLGLLVASALVLTALFFPPAGFISFFITCLVTYYAINDFFLKREIVLLEQSKEDFLKARTKTLMPCLDETKMHALTIPSIGSPSR